MWSRGSFIEKAKLVGHKSGVTCIQFLTDVTALSNKSKKSSLLASGSNDATVKLWNVDEEKCLKTIKGSNFRVKILLVDPAT